MTTPPKDPMNLDFTVRQMHYTPHSRMSDTDELLVAPACHSRWSDAALEQFVRRFEAYLKADEEWKKAARADLDSLLDDRTRISGGKTALIWISAILGSIGTFWVFVVDHFHISPK